MESDSDSDDMFADSDDEGSSKKAKAKARAAAAKAKAKAAAAKKTKKPAKIESTQCVYDVKTLEAGQDMVELERVIRNISLDGLTWGEEFAVQDVAYGIQKVGHCRGRCRRRRVCLCVCVCVCRHPGAHHIVVFGVVQMIVQCVIVNDKVSTQDIEDEFEKLEDYVQSVDLRTMNRL